MTKEKRKISKWWIVPVVILLVFLGIGPFLEINERLEQADAIVVISGGGGERINQGVNLYHEEWAPLLIVSGDAFSGRTSNAEVMKYIALKKGVPDGAIVVEPHAETTYENALYVKELLEGKDHDKKRVILVTSEYHSRRAEMVFEQVLDPLGVDVIVRTGDTDEWNKWGWWMSKRGWYLTGSEMAKVGYMLMTGEAERGWN